MSTVTAPEEMTIQLPTLIETAKMGTVTLDGARQMQMERLLETLQEKKIHYAVQREGDRVVIFIASEHRREFVQILRMKRLGKPLALRARIGGVLVGEDCDSDRLE